MPISSLIVRTTTGAGPTLAGDLTDHPAIEVCQVTPEAVAIVTETPEEPMDRLLWKQLEAHDAVTHVELIYHNFEELESCHEEA